MKKTLKKKNSEFNFSDVIIDYCPQGILYAYYLSNDNAKNKEVDLIIKDMWYTRDRLVKNYPLVEVQLWFEYKRLWLYISNDHLDEIKAERDRRANIRNAKVL